MSNSESGVLADQASARASTPTPGIVVLATSDDGAAPALVRMDQPTVISNRVPAASPANGAAASPLELRKLLLGEKLDHFEVLDYIGGGGMGAVFRARDATLDRIVAVKVLAREQSVNDETVRRFHNEAQSAARLDHDNIARAYYVGEDRGLHFIVFEYIQGVNIRAMVEQRGPLPLAEACSYTLQVALALAHACSRDVVHRDIKPSNVLITADGRAKLVDMGLARLHQVDRSGDDLTASGVTLGTFDYISPEQARDPRTADVRSDLYSLGCTLYFMLTARPPFPEGTVLQKLLQHQGDAPPDPAEFNPGLPHELTAIVRKMMAKDPKHRYQHPDELVGDLLSLAERQGWQALDAERSTWVAPPRGLPQALARHVPWMAPLAALIAIVLVLDHLWSAPSADADMQRSRRSSRTVATVEPQAAAGGNRRNASNDDGKPAANAGKKPNAGGPAVQARGPKKSPDEAAAKPRSDVQRANQSVEDAVRPGEKSRPAATGAAGRSAAETEKAASRTNVAGVEKSQPSTNQNNQSPATGQSAAPSTSAATAAGVLVVDPNGTGDNVFTSLKAATVKAKNFDVIELRYNGPLQERPFVLNNLRLTIRSGEKFRPVVLFRPDDVDPLRYPRSMITVAGGQLSLVNVSLELDVPHPLAISAQSWTMFETQRAEQISLSQCTLTISNASESLAAAHSAVAFFDVTAAPGNGMMDMGMNMDMSPAVSSPPVLEKTMQLQLTDCIARGEAVFLRSRQSQPFELTWENGLLATSESLLLADVRTPASQRAAPLRMDIRLSHVTALVRGGLCVFDGDQARDIAHAEVKCSNCILIAGDQAAVLERRGVETAAADPNGFSRGNIVWVGDRNFYEGFRIFWRTGYLSAPPDEVTWDKWKTAWGQSHESSPPWGPVAWKRRVDVSKPIYLHAPADYALDESSPNNPALRAATDGRDVGFDLADLPSLEPAARKERATSDEPAS